MNTNSTFLRTWHMFCFVFCFFVETYMSLTHVYNTLDMYCFSSNVILFVIMVI